MTKGGEIAIWWDGHLEKMDGNQEVGVPRSWELEESDAMTRLGL